MMYSSHDPRHQKGFLVTIWYNSGHLVLRKQDILIQGAASVEKDYERGQGEKKKIYFTE